jgi:hypothetical protein
MPAARKRPGRSRTKTNVLAHREMLRPGSRSQHGFQTRRLSVDFIVDGRSLLETLDGQQRTRSDLMGCLVAGYPEANAATRLRLLGRRKPGSPEGRVLLYICPECGDVGCGAYGARVQRRGGRVIWRDFARESAGDTIRGDPRVAFTFDARAYAAAITAATAAFSAAPEARAGAVRTSRTSRAPSSSRRRAG